jgi:hypothetical protein
MFVMTSKKLDILVTQVICSSRRSAEVRISKAKKQTSHGQKERRTRADGIPIVVVTAPDGRKSLWLAAVARDKAEAAVAEVIPANHVATLTRLRLTLTRRSDELRPGEVRRVKL